MMEEEEEEVLMVMMILSAVDTEPEILEDGEKCVVDIQFELKGLTGKAEH